MKLRYLKIKELRDYLNSPEYQNTSVIPITPQRVESHIQNPRASPEDISLILAEEENGEVIGFIGLLPEEIKFPDQKKCFWISCWWSHPQKGKSVGVPLLLAAYQCTQGLLLADASPDTLPVFKKTKFFHIPEPKVGLKLFLLPALKDVVLRKRPSLKKWSLVLSGLDKLFSFLFQPISLYQRWVTSPLETISAQRLTDQENMAIFFKPEEENHFRRTAQELEWINRFPWILPENAISWKSDYPFSHAATHFENHLIGLSINGSPIAFLFLVERDGVVKLGYSQIDSHYSKIVATWLIRFLLEKKAKEFITFDDPLIQSLKSISLPFCYKHSTLYQYIWGKPLGSLSLSGFSYGDGDAIFT